MRVKACPAGDQVASSTKDKGRKAEDRALRFLSKKGYQVLERNVRFKEGELDIVAIHAGQLCFVEVRSRASARHGGPEETISKTKQARLLAAARRYLQKHPQYAKLPARFDVVAIQSGLLGGMQLIQDAFEAQDAW